MDFAQYQALYRQSLEQPDSFWATQAERLDWTRRWTRVSNWSFGPLTERPVQISWFEGAQLNVAANCVDRHAANRPHSNAIIWVPDDPNQPDRIITYGELHDEVQRFSSVLRELKVSKGDRVTIYLPMIPEALFAMLACARIGAIHSVVFGGFSAESLSSRIQDCGSTLVITADEGVRGGRTLPLKRSVDQAIATCPTVQTVLVVKRTGGTIPWDPMRDRWYHELAVSGARPTEPLMSMGAEDPLFILYTSGSTGKPKGALHTSGGYLLYASLTHQYIFDYQPGEVYWCTADIGWITGHSYVVYGPLSNGATVLIHEGVPLYPTPARHWEIVDKYRVNIYYTAPTLIRSLIKEGDQYLTTTNRESLRVLGSVGEPINPSAWQWYFDRVGGGRCPIVDTWWQTETGGILISPLAGVTPLKPGSATLPFFGIQPTVVDSEGRNLSGACEGSLCLKASWPGQMRTVYGNHKRLEDTYFSNFPGMYFTGDGCRRDEDGYYWITGRTDDVLKVSGHRIGTAEVEAGLNSYPDVAESAVIGIPHEIKGQAIYAFVTLRSNRTESEELRAALTQWIRQKIGPVATPEVIQFAASLPKTRSGKIMRRILRKIAEGDFESLGDTSTLADPNVVNELREGRPQRH